MLSNKSIVIFAAVVSGVSVFVNSFAVKQMPNAYLFTTAKNIIVASLIFAVILALGKWQEIKKLTKKDWLKLYFLGLIGGSVPFLLFFQGLNLSKQTALNGAFIQKTMFVWVALLMVWLYKEKITVYQKAGFVAILSGIVMMGGVKLASFGQGELLVLIATLLWSVEAIFVSKYAMNISSEVLSFGRMFFGALFMLSYLLITQEPSALMITKPQFGWIYLTAGFLAIYVFSYYKSLSKFKATEVTAILTLAFPITVICQVIYSGKPVANLPALALIIVGAASYLLSGINLPKTWKVKAVR